MNVNIKLDVFEGPFDLLYQLIEKNKINIYDIPISDLTNQYLDYIYQNNLNLDIKSEFLVMAADLIEIKSKMLLPENKNKEAKVCDPRQELVNKLIEYKKFKEIASKLNDIQLQMNKRFFRNYSIKDKIQTESNDYNIDELLKNITLADIFKSFENLIKLKNQKLDKVRSSFKSIKEDLYTIENQTYWLLSIIESKDELEFKEVFKSNTAKMEIVVTFLSLLELVKTKQIHIYQDDLFQNIVIKRNSYETNRN